jgi:murein L,D-transpeptidase YcbB/YkuD
MSAAARVIRFVARPNAIGVAALGILIGAFAGVAIAAQPPPASTTTPSAAVDLQSMVAAGNLPGMRWPNFSDYRAHVSNFYQTGNYSFAWIRSGEPTPQALAMIELFKQAAMKGLRPTDYDSPLWDARLKLLQAPENPDSAPNRARFDLAMTICAMRYISDLHIGRVNPRHFKFGLDVGPNKYDLPAFLRSRVIGAPDVYAVITTVEPPYAGYQRAEIALAIYQKLAAQGDGPPLPAPPKAIHPGGRYAAIGLLRARLRQLGDLAPDAGDAAGVSTYQGSIVSAVRHFQRRLGMEPDGILGKATVAEVNVPLRHRVEQFELTLERYRWIPPNFPQPPIVVNIPEFLLRTMRRQPAPFLSMRVIVGKAYRARTPVFANEMRYLIFRPYWDVPASIQRDELVPKTMRNRNYLAKNNYEVVDAGGRIVTDGRIDDRVMVGLRSGAYRIRQKPGPKNALGLVKFIFPNSYNVYLHSTPAPELFSHARRDFSHGCIRVQHPAELAAWVLRDNPGWDIDRVRATMNGDQALRVNLARPIPVLILYSTAVVEPDGEIRFFDDLYGYDAQLERALDAGYPYPG